jgi:hypothetical protein
MILQDVVGSFLKTFHIQFTLLPYWNPSLTGLIVRTTFVPYWDSASLVQNKPSIYYSIFNILLNNQYMVHFWMTLY